MPWEARRMRTIFVEKLYRKGGEDYWVSCRGRFRLISRPLKGWKYIRLGRYESATCLTFQTPWATLNVAKPGKVIEVQQEPLTQEALTQLSIDAWAHLGVDGLQQKIVEVQAQGNTLEAHAVRINCNWDSSLLSVDQPGWEDTFGFAALLVERNLYGRLLAGHIIPAIRKEDLPQFCDRFGIARNS